MLVLAKGIPGITGQDLLILLLIGGLHHHSLGIPEPPRSLSYFWTKPRTKPGTPQRWPTVLCQRHPHGVDLQGLLTTVEALYQLQMGNWLKTDKGKIAVDYMTSDFWGRTSTKHGQWLMTHHGPDSQRCSWGDCWEPRLRRNRFSMITHGLNIIVPIIRFAIYFGGVVEVRILRGPWYLKKH